MNYYIGKEVDVITSVCEKCILCKEYIVAGTTYCNSCRTTNSNSKNVKTKDPLNQRINTKILDSGYIDLQNKYDHMVVEYNRLSSMHNSLVEKYDNISNIGQLLTDTNHKLVVLASNNNK